MSEGSNSSGNGKPVNKKDKNRQTLRRAEAARQGPSVTPATYRDTGLERAMDAGGRRASYEADLPKTAQERDDRVARTFVEQAERGTSRRFGESTFSRAEGKAKTARSNATTLRAAADRANAGKGQGSTWTEQSRTDALKRAAGMMQGDKSPNQRAGNTSVDPKSGEAERNIRAELKKRQEATRRAERGESNAKSAESGTETNREVLRIADIAKKTNPQDIGTYDDDQAKRRAASKVAEESGRAEAG